MTKKFLVEFRDKLHIVTAEKIEKDGQETTLRILKPRDDEAFSVAGKTYRDFWLWLKDEKSFLQGESLDFCFLYPDTISPSHFIEEAKCLKANISRHTEITMRDVRLFLGLTGRKIQEVVEDGEKTLLHLDTGDKLLAVGAGGKGLAAESKNNVPNEQMRVLPPESSVWKREHRRPKAFKITESPAELTVSPVITTPKLKPASQSIKNINTVPYTNSALPKATAADIQLGIKYIIEDQCKDVDFKD